MIVEVKVKCGKKANSISRINNIFEVNVVDLPIKGKANKRVQEIISEFMHVPKSNVKIIQGLSSNNKKVEILE